MTTRRVLKLIIIWAFVAVCVSMFAYNFAHPEPDNSNGITRL